MKKQNKKSKKTFQFSHWKNRKKPWKNENCPMKKTTPQPSEMKKKRNFDFDIMCHQFLHAFCLFCHVLPHTTTTIYYSEKTNKNSSKLLRFSLILFLIIQKLFLCFRKNCRKNVDNERKPKSFPFLNSPLPHVSCQLWMMMLNGWNKVLFWHIRKKNWLSNFSRSISRPKSVGM